MTAVVAGRVDALEPSVFGGAEFDNHGQGFAYLGTDLNQKISEHFTAAGRLTGSFLTYKYRSGGEEITATAPGGAALGGLKGRWGQTSAGLLAGVAVRDTNLDPDDRHADVRGTSVAPIVQAEFDTWLPSRTNLNYFGSFDGTDNFIYQKGTVKQQLTNLDYSKPNTLNGGVEFVWGSNPNFDMIQVGLVLEVFNISRTLSLVVHGGYRHDTTFGSGGYGGLAFFKGF